MHLRFRFALLAATALYAPSAFAASCSSTAPNYANVSGGFGALNGQIYQQNGQPFIAHGVNIGVNNEPSVATLQATMPGVNFVRLAINDFASPGSLQAYVTQLTAAGIVVEIEDHSSSDGSDRGGSQGTIYTGTQLQTELAWYSSIATAFKSNPYVWFGTNNEPSEINPATGQMDPAALSTWQQQTYQAIRNTGNNSPIMLEINGWGDPSSFAQGYTSSVYAGMTNVIADIHDYGWLTNYSTDQATNSNFLAQAIAATQQKLPTADGTIPVIIGEYGNSTTGVGIDANGSQVVTAVDNSGFGSAAWAWNSGNPGDGLLSGNSLSSYGQQVAAYVASSGATGCAIVPAALAPAPAPFVASTSNDTANLSVAQVAALAASTVASAPASSSGSGGTLTTDQIAAIAAGPVANVAPIQHTTASPTGTMPTPDPVSDAASWSASDNYGTVVPASGNTTGTVSGTGNTINATGGIQTISVTGPGNTITTGPYNDTVTVQTAGNTINLGGGNDTLNLAYNGQQPSSVINADAAAIPPLASAGNVIVLPAPGTGVLTINGVMAANDRLDVTKALAGTTWNGSQSTVWNYVAAAATPQGCTISVGGQIIATLPNGSPGGQLGNFIVAVD